MSYLQSIEKKCQFVAHVLLQACEKKATYELRGNRNELMGFYCEKHGKIRKQQLDLDEKMRCER